MNERPIYQEDHFFDVGQKIVNIKGDWKKASLNDLKIWATMYVVTEVNDRHRFKCREWRKY